MSWYKIENKADKAEIWIYEMIGKDWWSGDGMTAKSFQEELSKIKTSQIDLHINSPGGEVFDGITIYNMIKQHPASVTTYIDGLAASIASVIALSGDRVVMAENALFMIHNPRGGISVFGEADDIQRESEKMVEILSKVRDTLLTTYSGKSNKSQDDIRDMMKAETWMNAEEALQAGFIDEIAEQMDLAACAKFVPAMAKAGFKHIPETINEKKKPTAKDAERGLRDVGFSVKQAKTIVAKGLPDDLRDVDDPEPAAAPRDVEPKVKDRQAALLEEGIRFLST